MADSIRQVVGDEQADLSSKCEIRAGVTSQKRIAAIFMSMSSRNVVVGR